MGLCCREAGQTWSFRGSKSRNKVTVGEPAVGSLKEVGFRNHRPVCYYITFFLGVHILWGICDKELEDRL